MGACDGEEICWKGPFLTTYSIGHCVVLHVVFPRRLLCMGFLSLNG